MQLSGAVVDLLDLQGSSVAICLEDGWDTTAQVFGSATLPRPLLPHPGRLPRPRREGVDRLPPLQPPQQPQRQLTNGFRSGRGDVGVVDNSGSGAPKKTDDKSFYSVSVGTVSGTVECKKSRQKQFPIIVFPQNVIV
jgi:hypothetical protein